MRTRSAMATILLVALLAACSSGAAAPTGPAVDTTPASQPTGAVPQPSDGSAPGSSFSFALPSFAIPSFAIPSFMPDPALQGAFPTEIDGQPLTNVQAVSFLSVMQSSQDQADIDAFVAAMQALGLDPASVGYGSGTVEVDGEEVTLQAVRTPGTDPRPAIDALIALDPPDPAPTISSGTVGGKPVTISTFEDGDVDYYYISGDIAWLLSGTTEDQAATILGALP